MLGENIMTDVTSSRVDVLPNPSQKLICIRTGTTVTGATDTVTLTLADYGITRILGHIGFVHTTDYSVMVQDEATSVVSVGVLTLTTKTGNNNKRRVYYIFAE